MSDINNFSREFQSEIIDFAAGRDEGEEGMFKENAFSAILSEDLSFAGILESPTTCFFETGPFNHRMKANGYSIPEEDSQLDVFISLYSGSEIPQRLGAKDVDQAFGKLTRFFEAALNGLHEQMEPGLDPFAMVREIWGVKDHIDRVRFLLFTDGIVVQRKERERKSKINGLNAIYEIWDLERLRRFRSSGSSHESVEVNLEHISNGGIPFVSIENEGLGYATSVAIIPGQLLYDLYEEYGQRLLELNVRSYLQARGKVNKGILETLVNEPERFLAYNNGITLVAEELTTGELKNGLQGITAIKGLQIVNGGQTTASIHRAGKERNADLSKVFVQSKITLIEPGQFDSLVPLISRYSNAQNKVSEVDLRANHAHHIGIERVSRKTWVPGEQSMWFYERARGSYQTLKSRQATTPARKREFEKKYPPSQRFSKEDLARFTNCWHEEPHIVSRGGQKNFASFMTRIGNVLEGWTPTSDEYQKLIGKAIIYKGAQKLVRQAKVPAFRVNVVNYLVAAIAHSTARRVDLIQVWDLQSISSALSNTMKTWIPLIEAALLDSAGDRNPTEWFKKEECWKHIRSLDLSLSDELKSELIDGGTVNKTTGKGSNKSKEKLTHEDLTNIARCMELDADQWHKIGKLGKESSEFKNWECGIANTLSGYALNGWEKRPSKKQAFRGVEMIKKAEKLLAKAA